MARRRKARRRGRHGERLTLAGLAYIGIVTMMAAAAIKNDAAVTLILLGGMMGALGASAFVAGRTVRRVDVTREAPDRLWQGQPVYVSYFLTNTHRWFSCMGLIIRDKPQAHLQTVNGYCTHLRPRGTFRSGARILVSRRGRTDLSEIQLSTRFPFSLVRAWRRSVQAQEVVVWPARGRLKAELLQRGAALVSAAAPSPTSGGQDEFFGLRDFREDDNPRLIHWRRSAGRPNPLVREMTRPRPDVLMIVIDTATDGPVVEKLLRLAATLVDHAMTRGYQVGLVLPADGGVCAIPPATGRAQLRGLLDALAEADANASGDLAETVAALRPDWLRHAQVMILSPVDDPAISAGALRRHAGHVMVLAGEQQIDAAFEDAPASQEGA